VIPYHIAPEDGPQSKPADSHPQVQSSTLEKTSGGGGTKDDLSIPLSKTESLPLSKTEASEGRVSRPSGEPSHLTRGSQRRRSIASQGASIRVAENTSLSYDRLMASKEGVARMLLFAQGEFSDENLRFWMEVQRYRAVAKAIRGQASSEDSSPSAVGIDGVDKLKVEAGDAIQVEDIEEDGTVEGAALEDGTAGVAALEEDLLQIELEVERETLGKQIIDTFLCKTAESLVNLPASLLSQFAEPSATGGYKYSATIFDAASTEIYSMIQRDTFERFTLSDGAEELVWNLPMLAVGDTKKAFSNKEAQAQLRDVVRRAQELVGAERVTAWLVDAGKMWNVSSTMLGNTMIELPVGTGLAGMAALTAEDEVVADAYDDPNFSRALDQKTGFRTRSVLCVPLKREDGTVSVVLQMLNKIGPDRKQTVFDEVDAKMVRAALESDTVSVCDAIALASMSKSLKMIGIDTLAACS